MSVDACGILDSEGDGHIFGSESAIRQLNMFN